MIVMKELVTVWPILICLTYLVSRLIYRFRQIPSGNKHLGLNAQRESVRSSILWYLHGLICLLLVSRFCWVISSFDYRNLRLQNFIQLSAALIQCYMFANAIAAASPMDSSPEFLVCSRNMVSTPMNGI